MPSIYGTWPKKLMLLALLASLAGSALALTVSIAPAEGLTYAPAPEGTGSPLGYFVSGCLGALYDSGCVATNTLTTRLPRDDWGSASYALAEAREGLVDYVIAVYVEWRASAFHKTALLPSSIAYRVVRVLDGSVVGEGRLEGAVDSEEASTGFARTASLAGNEAARKCVMLISTLVVGGEK
jgi:hypothetical protein